MDFNTYLVEAVKRRGWRTVRKGIFPVGRCQCFIEILTAQYHKLIATLQVLIVWRVHHDVRYLTVYQAPTPDLITKIGINIFICGKKIKFCLNAHFFGNSVCNLDIDSLGLRT